jgi:hypothetical protein
MAKKRSTKETIKKLGGINKMESVVIPESETVNLEADEDEMIIETAEILEDSPELVADEIREDEPEVKIDPIVEKTSIAEKQHEMFYNLEEGRINLEDQEREKAALIKAKELEAVELERKNNEGKPKLTCPFCQNIQYDLNSKDVTTSWCMSCGRAFMVNWV